MALITSARHHLCHPLQIAVVGAVLLCRAVGLPAHIGQSIHIADNIASEVEVKRMTDHVITARRLMLSCTHISPGR